MTIQIFKGQAVYEVIKKNPECETLKKGYQICLDSLHFDHFEVYGTDKWIRKVIDLAGNELFEKTARVAGRRLP